MSALSAKTSRRPDARTHTLSRFGAIGILQAIVIALWVFPSDYVNRTLGGMGYVAGLIAMLGCLVWVGASILGLHDPRRYSYPTRGVLAAFWIVSLASYAVIDLGTLDHTQLLGSERWFMQLAAMTGIFALAAEGLHSLLDIKRVLRATCLGATFCAFVAALQYQLSYDLPVTYMRFLPGFRLNVVPGVTIISRNGLNRVTGTTIHPIELGVTAGMLLPLAIWLAIYDTEQSMRRRVIPVIALLIAIAVSVSRSADIAVALSMAVLIVLMPVRQRLATLAAVPVAIAGAFMTAHGLIGTLVTFFGLGSRDSSIAHRTNTYPYVEALVRQHPFLGTGGGTYDPVSQWHILDNQYLSSAVELGVIGAAVLLLLFVVPLVSAFVARRRTKDEELRLLLAALGGAVLAAGVCSATFDSFSFPVFYCTFALVIGLVGAAWRLVHAESTTAARSPRRRRGVWSRSGVDEARSP
jgi:O-antigen ligase